MTKKLVYIDPETIHIWDITVNYIITSVNTMGNKGNNSYSPE